MQKGFRSGIYKKCVTCGKKFYVYPSRINEKLFCCMACYRKDQFGREMTPDARKLAIKRLQKCRFNKVMPKGKNHHGWKGEKAGYRAIHYWVERQLGKPKKCSICGTEKNVQWANKDHKYKRNVEDYFEACSSCHKIHDIKIKKESLK